MLEFKHISLYKRALDLLVRPGDKKFVVMIGLEGTHIILKLCFGVTLLFLLDQLKNRSEL